MEEIRVNQVLNDIVGDNIQKLATLFPAVVKDGKIDYDALKAELGEPEEVGTEKFELTWAGKAASRRLSIEDIVGKTLKLETKEGKNTATTENLYIEGDNLEVLKLLRQNYYGTIKMIYIDPPYNTGNDFIYNDSFIMDKDVAEIASGVMSEAGERFEINKENQNRYHANWLNMMYPRLRIAKDLLTDDGVIFISIDDKEQDNLKKICDEIFAEGNFVGRLILKTATDNNPRQISTEHEYILCYAKDKSLQEPWTAESESAKLIVEKYNELKARYGSDIGRIQDDLRAWIKKNAEELKGVTHYDNVDEKGVFHDGDIANTVFGGYMYSVIHPVTGKECKIPEKGFRFTESTMREMIANGDIMFGEDETTLIKPKKRVENAKDLLRSMIYEDGRASTKQFETLMARDIFQNPKSPMVLERLMSFILKENDTVLDFFSGSATTAEAVMRFNAKKNKKIKYIMVQLPEDIDESMKQATAKAKKTFSNAIAFLDSIGKAHNICEIGKERIRRSGDKILEDFPDCNIDIGFKVFKVGSSNIKWNSLITEGQLDITQIENTPDTVDFMPDTKDIDVVYEVMLRQRDVPLSEDVELLEDIGKRTYLYAASYLVCLETDISTEMIDKIAAIDPTPVKFIFRDSAFKDDIAFKDETFRRLKAVVEKNSRQTKTTYTVEFI